MSDNTNTNSNTEAGVGSDTAMELVFSSNLDLLFAILINTNSRRMFGKQICPFKTIIPETYEKHPIGYISSMAPDEKLKYNKVENT